jgi:hypothetical protein
MDLTAEMDPQARQTIDTARTAVGVLDLLAIALPLLALGLVGLLGSVSSRRSNGLWRVGGTVAVVGLLCAGLTWVAASMLPGVVPGDSGETPAAAEAGLSVATDALGVVTTQSVLLVVVGLLLVAAGVGVRRGVLPVADDTTATDSGAAAETD